MSTLADPSGDALPLENFLSTIDITPETFLQSSPAVHAASLAAAKKILDPVVAEYSVFKELALRGLDIEQVWEQIRLVAEQVESVAESHNGMNVDTNSVSMNGTKGTGSGDDDESEEDVEDVEEDEEDEILDDDEDVDGDESIADKEEEGEEEEEGAETDSEFPFNPEQAEESADEDNEPPSTVKPFKKDVHGLNDEFFSIDDFNRLSEQQDAQPSDDKNGDEIDYFAGPPISSSLADNRPR